MRKFEVNKDISHSAPWITEEDVASVVGGLNSGMIAAGVRVTEFEVQCSEYLGGKYSELTPSGQMALERALLLLDLPAGGAVIIPTYVCSSVEAAVINIGLRPLYCDIGETWCVTAESISIFFDSSVVAIIAVHLFGIKVDVESLTIFGVPIIEDCAQCFHPNVGSVGAVAIHSFHATKCLTTGEGGLLTIPKLSNLNSEVAIQSKSKSISDFQAVLGISQLSRYEIMLGKRKAIADFYFSNIPAVLLEKIRSVNDQPLYFRFPLFFPEGFNQVAPIFWDKGVMVRRGVDTLLHRSRGLNDERFPNAISAFNNTVSIPCYPALSDADIARVVEAVESVFYGL